MAQTGNHNRSDSVPWREAYPEFSETQLIGKALAGARYREGMTQLKLAEKIGIPPKIIGSTAYPWHCA
jgi:ribosome-binding protein aMBF1 (putative translation factor)